MTDESPLERRPWTATDGNFEAYTSDSELYKNFEGIEWMRFLLGDADEKDAPQAWILRFPPNTKVGRHYHPAHRLEVVISGEYTAGQEPRQAGPLGAPSRDPEGSAVVQAPDDELAPGVLSTGDSVEATNSSDGRQPGFDAVFPALDLDELRQLAEAVEHARYFDSASLGFLERQLDASAADDGSGGPRSALPAVLGLLATIERQAGDVRPAIRHDFVRLGTRAAELAGWLYRDLGSDKGAVYWRDRAFEWAAEIEDLPMCGYVLLRKSQAAWDGRQA